MYSLGFLSVFSRVRSRTETSETKPDTYRLRPGLGLEAPVSAVH
jgi:hypothetical protein